MSMGGLLLTGGGSTRLGVAKHELRRDGERLVDRAARVLATVCAPVLEVGPGVSELPVAHEVDPGRGPLAALVAGASALRAAGHFGSTLLLAVDMPFVETPFLSWVAGHPAPESVVPRVDGIAQPVCARYSASALATADRLVGEGLRSMHALLDEIEVTYVDVGDWGEIADAGVLTDVDTPGDLAALTRLGITHGE